MSVAQIVRIRQREQAGELIKIELPPPDEGARISRGDWRKMSDEGIHPFTGDPPIRNTTYPEVPLKMAARRLDPTPQPPKVTDPIKGWEMIEGNEDEMNIS